MNDLTEVDRHNLCDIAWFLKGFSHSDKNPFCGDHDETLEKVIRMISAQLKDKKEKV